MVWASLWAVVNNIFLICFLTSSTTAVSDEKKEGMIATIINENTLTPIPAFALELHLAQANLGALEDDPANHSFEVVYQSACRTVQPIIQNKLTDFCRSLNRRLQRDVNRLTEYYDNLIAEIRLKIERRHLEGKEREDEEARIRATELELKNKISDQREKYALKISVEPVNVLRFFLPVKIVDFEARFSKSTREISFVWNPLLKDFEPVLCEGCHTGLNSFWLCEKKAALGL